MNQFETVENVDAYHELANAVVVLSCDDYRDYKKHFRKNEDILAYINQRLGDVILEKIQNEQPNTEPSAERGKALFKKKEKKMQERLKKLFERGKKQ